jgi:hypothetical protein
MAKTEIGPKEIAQRALREQRAKETQKPAKVVKIRAIGKLQNIKKTTGRGR